MANLSYGVMRKVIVPYDNYVGEDKTLGCSCYRFKDNCFSLEFKHMDNWVKDNTTVYYDIPSYTNNWQPQPFSSTYNTKAPLDQRQELIDGWKNPNFGEEPHRYCKQLMSFLHFTHKKYENFNNNNLNFYSIISLKDCKNPYVNKDLNKIYDTLYNVEDSCLGECFLKYKPSPKAKILIAPSPNKEDLGGSWDSLRKIYEGLDNAKYFKLYLNIPIFIQV